MPLASAGQWTENETNPLFVFATRWASPPKEVQRLLAEERLEPEKVRTVLLPGMTACGVKWVMAGAASKGRGTISHKEHKDTKKKNQRVGAKRCDCKTNSDLLLSSCLCAL